MSVARCMRILAVTAALAAGLGARQASAANDPRLKWETLETAHFRVNYYSGEREIAERIVDHAEAIYARMVPAIGWPPSQRVEISITDQTDSANAFATALPYDSIRFFSTAPDDLSPLGDVDDWYEELVTHEFTHVLHTDHIRGIPAIVNMILGKNFSISSDGVRYIQLRMESDNVFNHTQFANPTSNFTSSNFGLITGAAAGRQTQLAAKIYF